MTKVYKFGGASVKDAAAVRNIAKILSQCEKPPVVVISAMGKTTNALEKVAAASFYKNDDAFTLLDEVKKYHYDILNALFEDKNHPVFEDIHNTFVEIEWAIKKQPTSTYDFHYDQIVSKGEILSTKIISQYLLLCGIKNKWCDAHTLIQTDNNYRDANVNWTLTEQCVNDVIPKSLSQNNIVITQGFIGGTLENYSATLGREGSDFSAAIIAYCLSAESVTIWKDVDGVLNADPKYFDDTKLLENISYKEAVELAYYGATVIHPRTIKPLQNKNIPLYVRSFVNLDKKGTIINKNHLEDGKIPSYIYKINQVLISVSPKDFSFIVEKNLGEIFQIFAQHHVKNNLIQNSAISFSVCVDNDAFKISNLLKALEKSYNVHHEDKVELLTIRHYNDEIIKDRVAHRNILIEQRGNQTARYVLK